MAGLFSLLFGQNRLQILTVEGDNDMVIDVSLNEEHSLEAEITENPVEDGSTISDHADLKPQRIRIEGLHSDTPVSLLDVGPGGLIRSAVSFFSELTRSQDAYEKMIAIWKAREPFTLVTGLKRYENMLIERITVTRNATIGKAIRFNMDLKEVRIVSSLTIPVSEDLINSLSSAKANLGQKATSAPLADTATKASGDVSILKSIFSSLFGGG